MHARMELPDAQQHAWERYTYVVREGEDAMEVWAQMCDMACDEKAVPAPLPDATLVQQQQVQCIDAVLMMMGCDTDANAM